MDEPQILGMVFLTIVLLALAAGSIFFPDWPVVVLRAVIG